MKKNNKHTIYCLFFSYRFNFIDTVPRIKDNNSKESETCLGRININRAVTNSEQYFITDAVDEAKTTRN